MAHRVAGSRRCSSQPGAVEGSRLRLAAKTRIAFHGLHRARHGLRLDPRRGASSGSQTRPRNAEVLFPYLNGEDLNSRPDCSASRWVIDFNDRSEAEASRSITLPFVAYREHRQARTRSEEARRAVGSDWWQF